MRWWTWGGKAADGRTAAHPAIGGGESATARGQCSAKKSVGLLCTGTKVSYRLVAHLQQEAVSVSDACRVLQVSRSGYYCAPPRQAEHEGSAGADPRQSGVRCQRRELRQPACHACAEGTRAAPWPVPDSYADARGRAAHELEA
ncbi:hypothetical protein CBM2634_U280011 [Cupriavidus taiwanensis]|uniref:Uncharacterized protein n=1 Tax=Cupriavidus taiwanensis TaxID=164546 RepID=A0A375JC54_9BURK|nr:hypothetical protein CBM2634_U280011 [Cupriavidus taiwanensis]